MFRKLAKYLAVCGCLILMGSVAKVQAGTLSGNAGIDLNGPSSTVAACPEPSQIWLPYHSEFSEVSRYLAAWAASRREPFLGNAKAERTASAGSSSQSESGGLPIQNESDQRIRGIDNTPDCQAGSSGAGSSAPERPPTPQSGLSSDSRVTVSQTVTLVEIEYKSLSVPKQGSRLFRPPRPFSLS